MANCEQQLTRKTGCDKQTAKSSFRQGRSQDTARDVTTISAASDESERESTVQEKPIRNETKIKFLTAEEPRGIGSLTVDARDRYSS